MTSEIPEEHATTAAPNSTTLPQEVSSVIPEKESEKPETQGTTAAHNTTTLPQESSSTVPDNHTEIPTVADATPAESKAEPNSASSAAVGAATIAATTPSVEPIQELWNSAKSHAHPEIWGVVLDDPKTHVPSQIVFQKYLNANDGVLEKAKDQLIKTLDWRAKLKPLDLIKKKYSTAKFDGLGFVTTYLEGTRKEVFTWNIYGGVKNIGTTFGDLNAFIEWRVALMELALQDLSIETATEPITAHEDPYKMFQVHDYKSVSFFRSPPEVRSASKEVISVFAQNYPELLKEKFFINVPAVMGFMYGIMKLFAPAKTVKKFHPMSDGSKLALEFSDSKVPGLGEKLPKEYGGKGESLKGLGKEPALE